MTWLRLSQQRRAHLESSGSLYQTPALTEGCMKVHHVYLVDALNCASHSLTTIFIAPRVMESCKHFFAEIP